MFRLLPYYETHNSVWVPEPQSNYPILTRASPTGISGLGYQAFYGHNSVSDPAALGGRWFGSKKRTKKNKKKTKKSKRSKKSKKSKCV